MEVSFEHSGPQILLSDIEQFEREIGAALPVDYREFLLKHNGGIPHPADFGVSIGTETVNNFVQGLFPLLPRDKQLREDLRDTWREAQRELEPGWLPIGLDGGGEWLALRLQGKKYGAVYRTDGYAEYLGRKPGMRVLAKSFTEFLGLLYDQRAREPFDEVYHITSQGKKQDLLNYLARGGRLSDKTKFGTTLTQSAAAHGNLEVLRACLEMGGTLEGGLLLAVTNDRWDVMRFLVENGADPNEIDPKSGETPLQIVMEIRGAERKEVEKYLRDHGARD